MSAKQRRVVALAVATACTAVLWPSAGTSKPTSVAAVSAADAGVEAAADEAWRYRLDTSTMLRLQQGLPVTQIDDLTVERHRKDMAFARHILARLHKLQVRNLSKAERVNYESLEEAFATQLKGEPYYWLNFRIVPYKSSRDFETINQALRAHSVASENDRVAYLALLSGYGDLLGEHLTRLKAQERQGLRLPKAAVESSLGMLKGLRQGMPTAISASADALAKLPAADQERFKRQVSALTSGKLIPALDRLIDYLSGPYLSAAPDQLGLWQYPHGRDAYRYLVIEDTGLPLDPRQVHDIGLKWVDEITARINARAGSVGFKGSLQDFYAKIKQDPRFQIHSAQEAEDRYRGYVADIEPKVARCFSDLPPVPYGVKRAPPAIERVMTYGYYSVPTANETTGYYYYNGADFSRSFLPERARIYHELIPGHHFQVSIQRAEGGSPYFRNNLNSAFAEGWAEYASSLGYEMNLYQDPYDDVGRMTQEMFIAVRLVVDTGIGYEGWTRERAFAYMREHMFQTDAELQNEILRYATMPGQAIGYGLGFREIWDLRHEAESELGDKFDIRAFHRVVLENGSVPLGVLKGVVRRYIDETKVTPRATSTVASCS